MTEVIAEAAPQAQPAILSGPSFAGDVARGLPTAVTLATADEALASQLVQALGSATFRPYHSTDVRGVEIGGAAKNVLAIAAGIVVGRQLGASAQAALTTRGFSELVRLGRACGAAQRNHVGTVRPRRPDPDLFQPAIAQFRSRRSPRPRRAAAAGQACRRRIPPPPVLIELAVSQNVDMPVSKAVAAILSGATRYDRCGDRRAC